MMKKIFYFMLTIIFTVILTACNIQSVEQFEQMEAQEESVVPPPAEVIEKESQPKSEVVEEKEVKQTEEPTEEKKETAPERDEQEKQEIVAPKKEAVKQETVKTEPVKEVTKKDPPVSANSTVPQKVETEQPQKKPTVTIAIRVDTLLKHWDLLDPSLQSEQYVPKNGVILKTTKYELLTEKDTVWNVLLRATKEHKIHLEYEGADENIYNSVYIEGINHLYEFSAGPLSGWMYKVNGSYPNYGASQYVLKDGDVIEWHYTVDLGRDLGHEWKGE